MDSGLRLFGSVSRSRTLLAIALLEQTYPREVARVTGVPLMSVQRIINDLQKQGVVSSRVQGTQREVRLNPAFFAHAELRKFLLRLALSEQDISGVIESMRRRPRRAGKDL